MIVRTTVAAMTAAAALFVLPGCAVTRGQSSVGEYIDDATITTRVKAKMVENKQVDAAAISVETLNGTVMLSGFAKNSTERATAEDIARSIKGVKSVRNEITVRPS
jgi:osmotically-inducible protein OsmY